MENEKKTNEIKMVRVADIINMTPHSINIKVGNKMVEIKSSGIIRASESSVTVSEGDDEHVKIIRKETTGISDEAIEMMRKHIKAGKVIIVSMITAKAIKNSKKMSEEEMKQICVIGQTIRDSEGRVVGADSIATIENI